ncbi:hypothetical protein MHBO_000823 [Bonamia ostreae]|uniref:FYVE-type domain-containing protein n=1 Tax=Bonamia ostreae TaxID=126728 RepID=A0ABV2AGX5_9EUKA
MVSCGSSHTAIIFESISPKECCLYAWGSNKSGQLGIPITNETSFLKLPTSVKLSGSPEFVECGSNHTFLKFSDNAIFSTGNNLRNQTGIVSKAAYENYKNEKKLGQKNINSKENSRSRRTFLKHKKIPIQSKIDSEIEAPIFYNEKFEKVLLLEKKSVSRIVCGGDCTLILTIKEWIEDAETSECMGKYAPNCKEKFSFVVRKHHCRYCGGIFCYVCANRFVYTNSKNSVRYCDRCYEQIK